MLKASVSSFVATVFSVSAAWATPTQSVTFDFANDPQGWTLEQQTGWVASGGNPGGHLETFTRPFDEETMFAVAAALERAAGFSALPTLRAGA